MGTSGPPKSRLVRPPRPRRRGEKPRPPRAPARGAGRVRPCREGRGRAALGERGAGSGHSGRVFERCELIVCAWQAARAPWRMRRTRPSCQTAATRPPGRTRRMPIYSATSSTPPACSVTGSSAAASGPSLRGSGPRASVWSASAVQSGPPTNSQLVISMRVVEK